MQAVQHWSAGWNRVGYGVDSPEWVMHGGTLAAAFDHVQSQLEFERDQAETDEREQAFIDVIDALTQIDQPIDTFIQIDQCGVAVADRRSHHGPGVLVTVDGWEFWVKPCYTAGCDQVNAEEGT